MIITRVLLAVIALFVPSITWKQYTDAGNHYQISYPAQWNQQAAENMVGFLSPKENDKDMFMENVNLMLQDLSQQPLTLDEYTALTKSQINEQLGANAIISLKAVTLAGNKATECIYLMDFNGRSLKLKQHWFIKGKTAFLFTYTAETTQYAKYEDLASEIVKSFKFTK